MVVITPISTTNTEAQQDIEVADGSKQKAKRTSCPGIRVKGNRIYDSENGVTCHQCRQKTRDFAASCKNLKRGKTCSMKLCHKCLLNRYGERAEEVEKLDDWNCPKCRGICNCSVCMKKRGQKPTGILLRSAKASGFSSVSEMVDVKASNNLEVDKTQNVAVSPLKEASSNKDVVAIPSRREGKENSVDGNNALYFESQSQKTMAESEEKPLRRKWQGLKKIGNGSRVDDACQNKSLKRAKISDEAPEKEAKGNANGGITICLEISEKELNGGIHVEKKVSGGRDLMDVSFNTPQKVVRKETVRENCNGAEVMDVDDMSMISEINEVNVPIPLPEGTMLTRISELKFLLRDVGHALQFLEFCIAFGKVLDFKKGEAEAILRELVRKQNLRKGQTLLVVQFQVKLLTLILSEAGDESPTLSTTDGQNFWLKSIHNLSPGADLVLKELELDCLEESVDGYYNLDLTKKLRLVNFLCDEALCTEKLRNFIEEQNSKFAEKAKGAKAKAAEAKEKERSIKQKLQDEIAKAIILQNGGPTTILKHESLISKIKNEAAKAHAEMLEAKDMVPRRKQRADAMRTEPVYVDTTGHAFWKLNCYIDDCAILMQDINTGDAMTADEKWHVFGVEQKADVEKYISSRPKKRRTRKVAYTLPNEISEGIH